MDGSRIDFMTLIFLVAAVLIFIKLRSVLGRRTGDETTRYERYRSERAAAEAQAEAKTQAKADGKVVTLPRRERETAAAATPAREPDADRAQRMTQFAAANSTLARGFIEIAAADRNFEPPDFLRGAKAAYEMIVMAFAEGNRAQLKDLLSPEVFEGFAAALDDRSARKETVEQSFVGIKTAEISDAELRGPIAHVTVKFLSELITATRNAAQDVVTGDPKRVKEVTDIWTFARDVGASTPNWRLVATQAAS